MALQLGALRDALIDAGASPEKAHSASEEVAAYRRLNVQPRDRLMWVLGGVGILQVVQIVLAVWLLLHVGALG